MIFVLHYILFSSGLSFVIILTALFLQTYSEASMAEIGGLLMALPFLSIFARPFFCALADRHQAHKFYLIGACFTMALGYGSLAVAPFFPDFIKQHGRLVWYLDMVGIIIGYSSFSVVFSLGDALALNAARKRGISWSLYRVWSTFSWGVFGYLIGLFNETPAMPKYVPGIILLVCSMFMEMILVAVWNKRAFDMNDHPNDQLEANATTIDATYRAASLDKQKSGHPPVSGIVPMDESLHGDSNETFGVSSPFGTVNGANTRLISALAGMVVEDIGSTLKSSLKMGKREKRAGLSEMLEQHGTDLIGSPKMALVVRTRQMSLAHIDLDKRMAKASTNPPMGLSKTFGPASGGKLNNCALPGDEHGAVTTSPPSLRPILRQTNDLNYPRYSSVLGPKSELNIEADSKLTWNEVEKYGDDLQILLLKFIVKRDRTIVKSLFTFTLFGFLMSVHASYFFVHVEEVCRLDGYDFSKLMGAMIAAQSVSEIFSFIVMVRYYMPLVGRMGSLLSCAVLFGARFVYYGTYFAHMSPYIALATEACHGLAYGMIYTLVCDCACDCVEQIGQYLPELISRGLIDPSINENQLKLPLRATMQGVFSGAFDGLGYGLGALFGGVFLDIFESYISLWQACSGISGLTFLYILLTHCRTQQAQSQH